MKHFILTTLLLITALSYHLTAQEISSTPYSKDYIHEDFNKGSESFKVVTTSDNYFILDKGDYLLSRNNNKSEYAIIANNSTVSDFVLKTAIRIGPSENKKASIGIILKAQRDGKGAIIFEINKQGEYRIKQLAGSAYQILTGNTKQDGWIKSKLLNGVDEHNFIEIRSEKNIYDVYSNSTYLTTFFAPDFTSGSCGIIISPETKARISYYYINIKEENNIVANHTNNTKNVNPTNELNTETKESQEQKIEKRSNKTDLATIITKQKKEITNLNRRISELQIENKNIWGDYELENKNIAKLQQININHQNDLDNKDQQIEELNQRVNSKKNKISNLNKKNIDLASVTLEQEKQIKTLQTSAENLRVTENESSANNKLLNKKISGLQQQISLEKSVNSEITNDLTNLRKSSDNTMTQLKNKVKEVETKIRALTKSKNTLATDLSLTKNKHQETKSNLSKSITNKTTEINNLTTELNTTKKQLKSAKKTSAELKECAINLSGLKTELNKVAHELTTLKEIQAKHNTVTTDLNTQITDLNNTIELLTSHVNTANNKNTALQTTNNELKELFILKDFEINGVKPSEMVKETSNIPPPPKALKGNRTIYSVQLGVYMQKQAYSSMKNINDVWHNTSDQGTYIYYSGEFNLPQEAASHMNELISKGYTNAFVVTLTK